MPKSEEQYKLLSDWEGRIKHLLVSLDSPDLSYADVNKRFGNLLRAFDDRSPLITVLSPTPVVIPKELRDKPVGPRLCIVDMSAVGANSSGLTTWVQDQLAVSRNVATGHIRLIDSAADQDMGGAISESAFVAHVAAQYEYNYQTVEHKITGGEILCGGDYVLCGDDLLPGAEGGRARMHYDARVRAGSALRRTLGVNHILWVDQLMRRGRQAYDELRKSAIQGGFGHVDMLTTLGGPVDGKPETHLVFVAQMCREYCAPAQYATQNEVFSKAHVLDFIAEELAKTACGDINFEVERVPMFVHAHPKGIRFNSFNNALVEVEGDDRRVYLPDYVENPGMENCMDIYLRTREHVQRVYTSRGFDVRFIAGHFPANLGKRGALRCATKVLDRTI